MLTYPYIDPVAFSLGPLKVHWYGLMYLFGFLGFLWLGGRRAKQPNSGWSKEQVSDLLFYSALGVVVGGRMGYVLFYNFGSFINDPLMLLRLWEGGMSFHGGLLGVLVAVWLFGRRHQKQFFQTLDFGAPMVPIGLGLGRIGNFINGELWGSVTTMPWGMVFPFLGPEPRHASQLYQALLEGLALFVILWWFSSKPRPRMAVSALFLICYGIFRFLVEFVRMPDAHLGYLAFGWLTMGQLLSLPMIIGGAGMLLWAYRRNAA